MLALGAILEGLDNAGHDIDQIVLQPVILVRYERGDMDITVFFRPLVQLKYLGFYDTARVITDAFIVKVHHR